MPGKLLALFEFVLVCFIKLDQSNALNMLFTSSNWISKIYIANYIHKCLSKRKDIIEMEMWSILYNEYLYESIFVIVVREYVLYI